MTKIIMAFVALVLVSAIAYYIFDSQTNSQHSFGTSTKNNVSLEQNNKSSNYKNKGATDSGIAVNNLNSQIQALEKNIEDNFSNTNPVIAKLKLQLMNLLLLRAQFLSSFSDFSKAEKLVQASTAGSIQAQINRTFYMATHQFDLVAHEIENLDGAERVKAQISLDLARANDLEINKEIQQAILNEYPTFSNLTRMAAIHAELGEFEQADKLLDQALDGYNNTLPFPIAYIYFQKGVMWAEQAGQVERAKPLYEQALKYLPQYVKAQVHLAEINFEKKNYTQALAGLEKVSKSEDPEVNALKFEIFSVLKKQTLAQENLVLAKSRYQELLRKYPLAFSDHGAEFYMSVGQNSELAIRLAQNNLSNRKNQRAFSLAIEAISQNNNLQKKLCTLVNELNELVLTNAPLINLYNLKKSKC